MHYTITRKEALPRHINDLPVIYLNKIDYANYRIDNAFNLFDFYLLYYYT
jgi:hypothetical protein